MPFLNLLLTVREHAAHALDVGSSNLLGRAQMTLTLRLLFRKNMIEVGLGSLVATLARFTEALGCAPVGLHLRHFVVSTFLALLRADTCNQVAAVTGGVNA